jgi:replicative DNA helicase
MHKTQPLKTGFQSIDVSTGGFLPGELIFIGGRPAIGKTILALDFLLNQSTGRNLIYVQLENDVARTNELIKLKATPIDLKMKILSNDLTPTFSEIEIGLSKHIVVHLEKPTMLDLFELLTHIVRNRDVDGIIIDSFSYIMPHIIPLSSPKKERVALRHLKLMAKVFNLPVFIFSSISRKVEKKQRYESRIMKYGSRIPVADWAFILFRWSYYGLKEDLDGSKVSEEDAMLAVVKSKRLAREYQPRLLYDYTTARFTSGSNEWYDYLEKNTPSSDNNCPQTP